MKLNFSEKFIAEVSECISHLSIDHDLDLETVSKMIESTLNHVFKIAKEYKCGVLPMPILAMTLLQICATVEGVKLNEDWGVNSKDSEIPRESVN